ncbi:hypothetical protein ACTL6P_05120 [Endozoicomonas acroporae]|uniref:hypothetical protein n=1 Tax=Endozoicomonas acroporae TaxID=1701104 RepID=UPI000C76D60F|nr:hypothetical protein [Endozoicomonas acroporae]
MQGLPLNGQPVTADAVVQSYQVAGATLELTRFKAEYCLRDLLLNDQQASLDAVDYERDGWLLENTILYSQLPLKTKVLESIWDNQQVLDAFNEIPGDHSRLSFEVKHNNQLR